MRRRTLSALLQVLLVTAIPARGQDAAFDLVRAEGDDRSADPVRRADSLLALLDQQDPARLLEIEARYVESGDPEKRLVEERFGLIAHHYRVDADPRGIYRRYRAEGLEGGSLVRALEEIVEGRYSAYYFFDGVIRPNVFAPDRFVGRRESALHEKIHLVQPSLYRALGVRCLWRDPHDRCVRSLEPVAVYLTEFASLERDSPGRTEAEINRVIERHLELESRRCGYGRPAPRCPDAEGVHEYIVEPLELAREVARRGLEEGIRSYIEGLSAVDVAGLAPERTGPR